MPLDLIIAALLVFWTIVGLLVLLRFWNSRGSVTWDVKQTQPEPNPDKHSITFSEAEIGEALRQYATTKLDQGAKL
jgi:hypothetical protein